MTTIIRRIPSFAERSDCRLEHDSEIICRCGKEFHDLEALIISLDDAGLTFYCEQCPGNSFKSDRNHFDLPYV